MRRTKTRVAHPATKQSRGEFDDAARCAVVHNADLALERALGYLRSRADRRLVARCLRRPGGGRGGVSADGHLRRSQAVAGQDAESEAAR
jgi:hypothetical protein